MHRRNTTCAALFTGPATPLTVTVARELGNAGYALGFARASRGPAGALRPILSQFKDRVACVEADPADRESMETAAAEVERRLGPVDLFVHTLGAAAWDCFADAETGATATRGPLFTAVACSRVAAWHAAKRDNGHIVHLVTRDDVGAAEVELRVLSALQADWARDGMPRNLTMSAIYFDDVAPLIPSAPFPRPGVTAVGAGRQVRSIGAPPQRAQDQEPRLLEQHGMRLMDEDNWIARVMLEREIGRLVLDVCSRRSAGASGAVQSFDLHCTRRAEYSETVH
jgi:hypothetical protein